MFVDGEATSHIIDIEWIPDVLEMNRLCNSLATATICVKKRKQTCLCAREKVVKVLKDLQLYTNLLPSGWQPVSEH